jgi:hypothetical protein
MSAAMNCLDFRRQLAAVPDALDAEARVHAAECPRCAQAYALAQAFEASLRDALAVPVPGSLADSILLRQTTAARSERGRRGSRIAWRAAAVVALAVAGGLFWRMQPGADSLSRLAVEHLPGEPGALAARADLPLAEVRALFAARGVALHGDPGDVDYLTVCPFGRDEAVHMVVQTDRGPVTVFYVGGRHEPERAAWRRTGMVGRTVPVAGGTLVLVAVDDARFDALESRWARALGAPALAAL